MRVIITVLTAVFCVSPAWCQDVPRLEVFAGYSYLNFDTAGVTSRLNLNGWEASAAFSLNRWVGLEGDIAGHYKVGCGGVPGLTCKDLSFMGGSRFTYRKSRATAFAHGLFGVDNGTLGYLSYSASDTPFATAVGGGVDYSLTKSISIRAGQVDYFLTRHVGNLTVPHQNNFRISTGVVFTFGGTRASNPSGRAERAVPAAQPAEAARAAPGSEMTSIGLVGYATEKGFKVTSVREGSVAERIFMRGDVIMEIDGKSVRSAQDIDSALAANKRAAIKVRNENMIPSDRELKLF